jgi:Ribonuclease G/E
VLNVGVVVIEMIEMHNVKENRILSEEKIQKIMKDTIRTNSNNGFLDLGETDGGKCHLAFWLHIN